MAPSKKPAPRKRKSKWTPENILTDPKSPLASADLRSILSNPVAWTALDVTERQEILSLFPDMAHTLDAETDEARPNFETLMNDDSFRYDCAAYVDNLARGRHDPQWLRDAWCAHESRKRGEFDWFLGDKFEEDWGVDIPDDMRVKMEEEQKVDEEREREVLEDKGGRDESQMGGVEGEDDGSTNFTNKDAQCLDEKLDNDCIYVMTED